MNICPLCGADQHSLVFSATDFDTSQEEFHIVECSSCKLAHTEPMPDKAKVGNYYKDNYYGSGNRKFWYAIEYFIGIARANTAKNIIKRLPQGVDKHQAGKVIDIGCGRAGLLKKFSELGFEAHGVERSEFPEHDNLTDIIIHRKDVRELEFPDNSFDIVIIWHVLEHLHEPFETLQEAKRILKPGGIIAIAVPNFTSIQARYSRSKWFHLDLPRHLYHFGIDNLSQAITDRGFNIKHQTTCSLEQNVFGAIQSILNCMPLPGRPNDLYNMLKRKSVNYSLAKLLLHGAISVVLMPFAVAEYMITCVTNTGASAIVFAEKPGR